MTIKDRFAIVLAGFCLASLLAPTAMAAEIDRAPMTGDDAVRAQPAAVEDEDTGICSKLRKRLWVESEGWIVRRVTICR